MTEGELSGPNALSAREEETLRLLAWGYSAKEVAARLGLSAKTVEGFKARGSEKLGLRTRVDLVWHAVRAGWFADGPPPRRFEPPGGDPEQVAGG